MKDAYSFDKDQAGLEKNYKKMLSAYKKIFNECGLKFITTEAESGAMGGSVSHEFMVPADIGEDSLFYCSSCKEYFKDKSKCPKCKAKLEEKKMVEIGHIFQLGTKYSLAQEALFLDEKGKRQPFIMGCYGIGVSRILSSIAEVICDEKGIIWPKAIAPFDVSLVVLDKSLLPEALDVEEALEAEGFSVLVDDRDEAAGVKFNDASLIGNPYILVMGKKYLKDKIIDVEVRATKKKHEFTKEQALKFIVKEYD